MCQFVLFCSAEINHQAVCTIASASFQSHCGRETKAIRTKWRKIRVIRECVSKPIKEMWVISKTGNCHFLNKGENKLTEDESVCRNICVHCLLRYLQVCLFRSCICKTHTVERKLCFSGPASERQKLHFTGKRTKKMTKESMNFEQVL